MNKPMSPAPIIFELNGAPVSITPRTSARLSEVLREDLGARDVKIGCNAGDCGACTVLVDGDPVCACLMPAGQAANRQVTTLKGLADDAIAVALKSQFLAHGAAQCGICTPGMLVSAIALLRHIPTPDEVEVQDALGGVLCRCTGYRAIIDAVVATGQGRFTAAPRTGDVGQPIPRVDGQAKVDGTEGFGDDIAPAGTLMIEVIRSPHPHADFEFGDLDAFAKTHGITTILTAADVTGLNRFGVIPGFVDQPVFAEKTARFRGEAIAAIIATPETIAGFDRNTFPVVYRPHPDVARAQDAIKTAAPQLHEDRDHNVMCGGFVAKGDAANALQDAYVTVQGHFQSGFVEHAYIEPEAGYAELINGRLHIHACTQAPVMDLDALALITGLDRDQIRIIPTGVGGGFGSKLDISLQPFIALATLKTGKPTRINYTRMESMQSTTKRHPSDLHVQIGADKSGRITAMDFDGLFNTGAYASWGPTVANRVPVHASGPYQIPNYRAEARGIHTHNPPSGAFRGFGVPQAAIAQESLFDELAAKLKIDPLDFRILNALENNAPTVCGQTFTQGVGIKACLEALKPAWKSERSIAIANSTETLKFGVGIAAGWYGCGNTSLPNPSTIKSGITSGGDIILHQGAMDIGQGANTVIAQIFATALGVDTSELKIIGPDTDVTPDAGKTSASRQTYVSGAAAKLSGEALRKQILSRVNASDTATLKFSTKGITVTDKSQTHHIDLPKIEGYVFEAQESYDPPTKPLDENGQGEPYAQFGYAAHIAVVAVDMILGTVKPIKFIAAHDVGKAINPMLVEGQVQGGIAQGLGMALMEEYIPGRTENLHDYLIPTIGDIPPIETLIIEEPDAHGPYGAKGLGEHVLIPTAPAILNAIKDATDVRITRVPVTPARLSSALRAKA
jgi:aldehyde oxidoreductase